MSSKIIQLAEAIAREDGQLYLVGGWVRDRILSSGKTHNLLDVNVEDKDYDCEVFNLEPEIIERICNDFGKVDVVGKSFGVLKLNIDGHDFDISVPRTDRKISSGGHKGFDVSANPYMDKKEACSRRDFSINAMLYDPLNDEVWDFFGGIDDLQQKTISHIYEETFVEDSLRVLRACQFAARFSFTIAEHTLNLCRKIDLSDLPVERIKEELFKLLLKSQKPSIGIKALIDTYAMLKLFPELYIVDRTILDEVARINILKSEPERLVLLLTALLYNNPQPEKFLDKMQIFTLCGYDLRKQVLLAVEHSDKPRDMVRSRNNYLRLANTGVDFRILSLLGIAIDNVYNSCCSDVLTFYGDFKWYDIPMENGKVKPILMGKHLLELGFKEGIEMGKVLKDVFEKQLDDEINTLDEAYNYVDKHYQQLIDGNR